MNNDPPKADLHRDHTREAIRRRLDEGPRHSYLRDMIYGAVDGAVTTFAVVCGVTGADLDSAIVLILGLANLFADGFSMAIGNLLGTRAEQQERAEARRMEEAHIRLIPEGEREEIRQIFERKGFTGDDLERAVEIITSDVERWVSTMLTEELGLPRTQASARRAAVSTFIAFAIAGALPLAPYLYGLGFSAEPEHMFLASIVTTGIAFFVIGTFKSRFVPQHWLRAGLETLFVGGTAAVLAYLVGLALRGIAP